MKFLTLLFTFVFISITNKAQNVGVGTTTPTDGRLHVETTNNATAGMFSNGTTGVSILTELNRPAIGMNMFYNSGYKFKGNGFGGLFYYSPISGNLSYYTSTASGIAGGVPSFSGIMSWQADGNVGIGTLAPSEARLQVHEAAGNTQFIAAAGNNLPGISTFVPGSSPSLGFNARYQGGYKFMGVGHAAFWQYTPSAGRLSYYYSSNTGSADGNISSVFALAIDSNGRFGIGTTAPKAPLHVTGNVVFASTSIEPATGYRLSIDGRVICEELKVQNNTAWPDYVFEKTYMLPSLESLEQQVMAQKHLPGIPSAAEVSAQNGIEVGDMQKRLLEKIEEMYRYMFQLNNENKLLKAELEALKTERR